MFENIENIEPKKHTKSMSVSKNYKVLQSQQLNFLQDRNMSSVLQNSLIEKINEDNFRHRISEQGQNKNEYKNVQQKNLFQYLKERDFCLVEKLERTNMIQDLYEYDKSFYTKYMKIVIHQQENENNKKKRSFLGFLYQTKDKKRTEMEKWKVKIIQKINEKQRNCKKIKSDINIMITKKGLPQEFRSQIWKFLIQNKLKINKELFQILYKQALQSYKQDSIIKKDIDRTYSHFVACSSYKNILLEATVLLQMFCIYRPDITYIQGMSYVMIMLLFHFEPYNAFKYFCNLVLHKIFLYKTYMFDKNYIQNIHICLEHIISKNYQQMYTYLKKKKLELWNIFWIEWIYAMFLRTFDIKTGMILWDMILIKEDLFVFKLTYVIFGLIDEMFDSIDKNQIFDEIRKLILLNTDTILQRVCNDSNHEFDFIFLEKALKENNLYNFNQ